MDLFSEPSRITKVQVREGRRIRFRNSDSESRGGSNEEPEAKGCRPPLGSRKGKKIYSSLDPPEKL